MKRCICCALGAVLLFSIFAGCSDSGDGGASESGGPQEPVAVTDRAVNSQDSGIESTAGEELSQPQPSPAQVLEGTVNDALSIIPGAGELAELEGGLFLLKEYGTDMGWSEANQLENLERGTPHDEVGPHHSYFLLLPKYQGARVEVNRLGYTSEGVQYLGESLYTNADTPNSYGLVLTDTEPEGMPDLAVKVAYEGAEYTYTFSYDGRGDRPAVQLFSGSDGPTDAQGYYAYVWSSEGRELQITYPASWTAGPHFTFRVEVDGVPLLYQVTIWPLESGELESALTPEQDEEVHRLRLEDGRPCLYVIERDSPTKYIYALEVDGMIQQVQAYCIPDADNTPTLYPPSEVDDRFLPALESIRVRD